MKLSVSNIGWAAEQDETALALLKDYGVAGLEIAPTRIFPEAPYEDLARAFAWAEELKEEYGLSVSSMQSIWFGRTERLFGTEEERKLLEKYTKRAVDFAAAIGCKNLVFGCPRNRSVPDGTDPGIGIAFFREIGDYAAAKGTVMGIEANPPIYHTNYINNTRSALDLIEKVDSPGFMLNLDVGTMIQNEESVNELIGRVKRVSHVHISEPGLKQIKKRMLHGQLRDILLAEDYAGFVSIEMGKADDLRELERAIDYVKGIFRS